VRLLTRKRQRPVEAGEVLHRLLDLLAPAQRVGNFVEPVEQDQHALAEQFALEVVGVAPELLGQLADDEMPQRVGAGRRCRRRQAGGKIAQHDAHRQQRSVRPALRLRLGIGVGVRFGRDRLAQPFEIGGRRTQQLAGHAQRDEIEEGRLAAARPAHEDKALRAVQSLEGRQTLRVTVPTRKHPSGGFILKTSVGGGKSRSCFDRRSARAGFFRLTQRVSFRSP
jgi:hypothetical protein